MGKMTVVLFRIAQDPHGGETSSSAGKKGYVFVYTNRGVLTDILCSFCIESLEIIPARSKNFALPKRVVVHAK